MSVIPMMNEVPSIANPMIRKSALPHLRLAPNQCPKRMRVSAFDQLNRALDGDILSRSKYEMNVIRHHNESVKQIPAFAPIVKQSFEKQSRISFDGKQFAMMPCAEIQKVSSGKRKQS